MRWFGLIMYIPYISTLWVSTYVHSYAFLSIIHFLVGLAQSSKFHSKMLNEIWWGVPVFFPFPFLLRTPHFYFLHLLQRNSMTNLSLHKECLSKTFAIPIPVPSLRVPTTSTSTFVAQNSKPGSERDNRLNNSTVSVLHTAYADCFLHASPHSRLRL